MEIREDKHLSRRHIGILFVKKRFLEGFKFYVKFVINHELLVS